MPMPGATRVGRRVAAYVVMLAAVGAALGANLVLQTVFHVNPYPLFFLAVMVAAWYGGLWPGLAATVLAAVVNLWFFLAPGHVVPIDVDSGGRILLFLFSAGCIVALAAALKRAEAEARRGQRDAEASRQALHLAPDGVIVADTRGRIVLANTQAHRMFGYAEGELIGQSIEVLVPGGVRGRHAALREGYHRQPRTRPMGVGLDLVGRRKDGSEVPVEISLSPMRNDHGLLVTSIIRDITERKKTEHRIRSLNEDLARRNTELTAVNRELEAFSYSVSHDLRAPLRAIDGFSQALLEDHLDRLDEEGREHLHRVRAAAQRMAQLIDDLLDLSRVTRREMRRERVDLSALAREAIEQLRKADPGRAVEAEIADGAVAEGDPHLLRIVLDNLLGNAWKFTAKRPDARVEFGTTTTGEGERAFFVRDNGVGFDMAYADKLFGAFQRLHGMTEFPGTGIGLATVQRVVHRHGGRVWADATPGRGATFFFTLTPKDA
jgi:PAS domain S-box-containing protein